MNEHKHCWDEYTALADRLVELGIGRKGSTPGLTLYYPPDQDKDSEIFIKGYSAEQFCHDWRVAGAGMEKCRERGFTGSMPNSDGVVIIFTDRDEPFDVCEAQSDSLPLAINLACEEALSEAKNERLKADHKTLVLMAAQSNHADVIRILNDWVAALEEDDEYAT